MSVRLQIAPFDLGAEVAAFTSGAAGAGAVVTFTGKVRPASDDTLSTMEIEYYPGMTERALAAIHREACRRWHLIDALIIHRHGALAPEELIMMVATASAHRVDAFEAAQFLMDYLKSRAPFWKKEFTNEGTRWVSASVSDENAVLRWD